MIFYTADLRVQNALLYLSTGLAESTYLKRNDSFAKKYFKTGVPARNSHFSKPRHLGTCVIENVKQKNTKMVSCFQSHENWTAWRRHTKPKSDLKNKFNDRPSCKRLKESLPRHQADLRIRQLKRNQLFCKMMNPRFQKANWTQKKPRPPFQEALAELWGLLQKPDQAFGGCVCLGQHCKTSFLDDA
jgi:hypothetical protein